MLKHRKKKGGAGVGKKKALKNAKAKPTAKIFVC